MIKLEAGEQIGAYRVVDFIARGGFSLVYLAENDEGQRFALKVGDVAGGGRYVTRFLRSPTCGSPRASAPTKRRPKRSSSATMVCVSTSSTYTRSTT
ncbi:MAG: hypothetical protein R3E96_03845 [Planctomycetota bacterium]